MKAINERSKWLLSIFLIAIAVGSSYKVLNHSLENQCDNQEIALTYESSHFKTSEKLECSYK